VFHEGWCGTPLPLIREFGRGRGGVCIWSSMHNAATLSLSLRGQMQRRPTGMDGMIALRLHDYLLPSHIASD
jgi:hypothetical protein